MRENHFSSECHGSERDGELIFFFVRWFCTVLTLAKSIFNVQQPEYMSAPWSVSFALVADSTESNVIIEEFG